MSSFNVRVFAIRRRPGREAFEVRWRVAARDKSRSFMTRTLAGSYRAELVRAARRGLAFDPASGEPPAWARPRPVAVTWYQHAVAYAAMKWPHLAAAHSRASTADALATVTLLLTRTVSSGPPARMPCGPVRVCVQPAAALRCPRAGPRQRARLAGTQLAAGQLPERPGRHPGRAGRAVPAAGWHTGGGEHYRPVPLQK